MGFVFFSTSAIAFDYREEIVQNVIEPCYNTAAKSPELVELVISHAQMVETMKITGSNDIERAIAALLPVVRGKDISS